jgi:hypothetical protein
MHDDQSGSNAKDKKFSQNAIAAPAHVPKPGMSGSGASPENTS